MENNNLKFYKESGNAPILNLILMFLSSSLVIFFISYYYSLIITYLPLVYFNTILVILYGFFVALLNHFFSKTFKIRNRKKVFTLTILLSFFAFYCQWASFFYIISVEKFGIYIDDWELYFYIFSNPQIMFINLIEISKIGLWEMFGFQIKDTILWLTWFVEFVLIIVASYFGFKNTKDEPFSEGENRWYKKRTFRSDFEPIMLRRQFIEEYKKDPLNALSSLKLGMGSRYAKVYLYTTPKGNKNLISIENVIVTESGKGNKEITVIIEPNYINNNSMIKIKEKFELKKTHFFDFISDLYS